MRLPEVFNCAVLLCSISSLGSKEFLRLRLCYKQVQLLKIYQKLMATLKEENRQLLQHIRMRHLEGTHNSIYQHANTLTSAMVHLEK